MNFVLHPWQLLLMIFASWVHREQQKIIEFYQTELEAVMKAQGKKRLLLTDDQRRMLAVKGKCKRRSESAARIGLKVQRSGLKESIVIGFEGD